MIRIVYWDTDGARIRATLDRLKDRFDTRFAPTLVELSQLMTRDRFDAVVVGNTDLSPDFGRKSGTDSEGLKPAIIFMLFGNNAVRVQDAAGCTDHIVHVPEALGDFIESTLASAARAECFDPPIFLGHSPAIRKTAGLVRKYALSRHPVLLLGETGTGKELAARALHDLSRRSDRPFIALNCAALPENLVESELFGTERGAFTDAVHRRGALASASGGTLFLDEIGAMGLGVQPRLLRALESGEFQRLGGEKAERSDFRLVCATCENLMQMTADGRFRRDLFYRISDLVILIPPLRERAEDIDQLAPHFCTRASEGRCRLGASALEALKAHSWPGNTRELRSVINRACADVQQGEIHAEDIRFISWFQDEAGACYGGRI